MGECVQMVTIDGLRHACNGLEKLWKKERQRASDLKKDNATLRTECDRIRYDLAVTVTRNSASRAAIMAENERLRALWEEEKT